jgi:predicted metalloprotease with PDZ domain
VDNAKSYKFFSKFLFSKKTSELPVPLFSKSQTVRQTQLVPSESWGGQGLLGVSIRFCSFEGANQNVWHIVAVQPRSPAEKAGLLSNTDYVLGIIFFLFTNLKGILCEKMAFYEIFKLKIYNFNF